MELEKQLSQIYELQNSMTRGMAKEEDIIETFKVVFAALENIVQDFDEKVAENKGEIEEYKTKLSEKIKDTYDSLKTFIEKKDEKRAGDIERVKEQLETLVNDLRAEIPAHADFTEIERRVGEVEAKIPQIPEELTAYQVRDKLEGIDNESEKLKIEAVQDLRKELDEIKKQIKSGGRAIFGGGFNYTTMSLHIIDDETPTGTINSSNTVFNIANTPSPASSLKVYLNGARQRVTEDYTLSGRTITFTIAPPTGSILLVDYRQ